MTSPSDRDLAQQWLAEIISAWLIEIAGGEGDSVDLAAAILDTPGVEVDSFQEYRGDVREPRAWADRGRRLVILLPLPPQTFVITPGTGVAAHQHTEEAS
jgi:hypothetical protein